MRIIRAYREWQDPQLAEKRARVLEAQEAYHRQQLDDILKPKEESKAPAYEPGPGMHV